MRFDIFPKEPLFFRDARPFDKGEGWATGIFPPLPSTVYGALRAAGLSRSGISYDDFLTGKETVSQEMGTPAKTGSFSIRSILLHDDFGPLVPMPLDLRRRDSDLLVRLEPEQANGTVVDDDAKNHTLLVPGRPDDDEDTLSRWLDFSGLDDYLQGKRVLRHSVRHGERFVGEPKIGIQISPQSGTAEGERLYFQEMIRLRLGYHIAVSAANGHSLGESGALKLGHDGRLCSYVKNHEDIQYTVDPDYRTKFVNGMRTSKNRFVILFTSPALLSGGWLPAPKAWNKFEISISTAVIGRPMMVAGWNMATGAAKPMRKAVPPGSVYYCKLEKGDAGELFDTWFDRNLSDADPDAAKQGFGHMLLGVAPS